MKVYTFKNELKNEIEKAYTKYISEFDDIPEDKKDIPQRKLIVHQLKN